MKTRIENGPKIGASINPTNICVVGCGHWGKNLIRNSHGLGHLFGICDSDSPQLESFRTQYAVNTYGALQEALLDPEFHPVVLATLADEVPVQVPALGGTCVQPNIVDVIVSNLLLDSATSAHIFVSGLHPELHKGCAQHS